MIRIIVEKKIESFMADIRDLCMSFFPYKSIEYIVVENNNKKINFNNDDIIVENYISKNKIYDKIDNVLNKKNNLLRKKIKNQLKKDLYIKLNEITNKNIPWGDLTGIRPINILTDIFENFYKKTTLDDINIYNLLKKSKIDFVNELNNNFEFINIKKNKIFYKNFKNIIYNYLQNEYLISDKKISQMFDIANKELEILNRKKVLDYKNKCSIYIGVPFCKTTCLYCSFTSYNIKNNEDKVEQYLISLENELKYRLQKEINIENISTIYVGGGTPTSLDDNQFEKFLNILNKYFKIKNKKYLEFTIEAGRPDTINEKKLKLMKAFGVSRISINPQTMNQKTLDLIGRKHTVEDVEEKFLLARSIGFDNINMDIILGLPNEKLDDVVNTLIRIGKLKPDSITVHSLALKRAARLNSEKEMWTSNYYLAGFDEKEIENMGLCAEYLAKLLNMNAYYLYRQKNIAGNLENIGYSLNKKECLYNIFMMSERHSVFGFGCGGVSKIIKYKKDGSHIVERIDGYKGIYEYINKWLNIK